MCQLSWVKLVHHKKSIPSTINFKVVRLTNHAKVYIKIELHETYNLVHIRKGDEWKMTFKTHYDHFKYVVMSFGLTNAPFVFQHLTNNVFRKYLDDFMVCYIDNILIFSKNMEDHKHHVHLVLEKLKRLDFMPNWRSVNSTNLKWNFWVTSSFEMAFTWIFIRFKPLLIGLFQHLFKMSNVFLNF